MEYTVTLSDLERSARMDIADAQLRLAHITACLHERNVIKWPRQCAYLRSEIAHATADIIEARGRIVALRKAGVR